jgi:putative membrane protein
LPLKVRIAVGIVLVLIGLIGIVSLPFSMMNGHRRDYWSSTYYSAATISAQGAGFSQFISMDQAKAIADHYLDSLNNPDLIIKEIMEFQNNFYIMIYEKSSGVGAFEMLIWKTDPSGMMGYDGNCGGMMGRGMMNGSGLGYGWWMPLGGAVFLTILIVGLYLLFSAYHKPEWSSGSGPIEILKGRYAKGEITGEQYQKMKKELE